MSDIRKPVLEIELRPVAAPVGASAGAMVYVMLPTLDELVGHPGFGQRDSICLPGGQRPFDPWSFFAQARRSARSLCRVIH